MTIYQSYMHTKIVWTFDKILIPDLNLDGVPWQYPASSAAPAVWHFQRLSPLLPLTFVVPPA